MLKRSGICMAVLVGAILLADGVSAKSVKLRFLYWGGNAQIQSSIAEWNKANPGIQVKFEAVDWGIYAEKLPMLMASGSPPDMFICLSAPYVDFAQRGLLYDLTPFYRSSGIKLDDVYPAVREQMVVGGKVYGTSSGGFTNNGFLGVNLDLLQRFGLPHLQEDWDMNDLLLQAKKLTKDTDGDGTPNSFGLSCGFNFWPDLIFGAGGAIFDKQGKKLSLNDPGSLRALNWMADLYLKQGVVPTDDGMGTFGQGKLAYMVQHTPGIVERAFQVKNKFKVGNAIFPADPVTKDRKFLVNVAFFAVAKGTKYPQETWKFLKWMAYDRIDSKPPAFGMPQSPPILKSQAKRFTEQPRAEWCKYIDPDLFVKGLERYTIPMPRIKRYDLAMQEFSNEWPKVRQGRISVAQFIANITPVVNGILGRK